MVNLSEILRFIETTTGEENVSENADITHDLGIDGDDFDELITEFSKQFNVDTSSCLWYFHSGEEGSWNSIGGAFVEPPHERVSHIPITPLMLLEFAKKGKWDLRYPDHKIPSKRYDVFIDQAVVLVVLSVILYKCAS